MLHCPRLHDKHAPPPDLPCHARCVQELGRSPSPVVRNNIMVALSDMVITYTALVSR